MARSSAVERASHPLSVAIQNVGIGDGGLAIAVAHPFPDYPDVDLGEMTNIVEEDEPPEPLAVTRLGAMVVLVQRRAWRSGSSSFSFVRLGAACWRRQGDRKSVV